MAALMAHQRAERTVMLASYLVGWRAGRWVHQLDERTAERMAEKTVYS